MRVELIKEFFVEIAHRVPQIYGSGSRMHGHSLKIEIVIEGDISPVLGWLIDYGDIKEAFAPLCAQLDHHYLNETPGMTDLTCPGIAAWIKERLAPVLPSLKDVRVSIVGDNAFAPVELPPDPVADLPHRIRFMLEAAQSLPHLPAGHPCRGLHGHTYRVEVGAQNLGRLRNHLKLVYDLLDHRYLNEVPGLEEATSERLCGWIWGRLSEYVDDLIVVVVQETLSARCIYRGE